jgi:hypothetical protein
MERFVVNSSTINSVGFENGILEVEFVSGSVYRYFDVPQEVFESLVNAPSVGEFFNENIRSIYGHERVS